MCRSFIKVIFSIISTHSKESSSVFLETLSTPDDLQQFHLEHERLVRPNLRRRSPLPIPQVRRDAEPELRTHGHQLQPLRPTRDHLRQPKNCRLAPLHAAVENRSVHQVTVVMHLDRILSCRLRTSARSQHLIFQTRSRRPSTSCGHRARRSRLLPSGRLARLGRGSLAAAPKQAGDRQNPKQQGTMCKGFHRLHA